MDALQDHLLTVTGRRSVPLVFVGGVFVGGLFHAVLGLFIGRIRFALPPLVTGLVVTMIGLALAGIVVGRFLLNRSSH